MDLLLGRGPIGAQQCARLLGRLVASGRHDKAVTPVVRQIEKEAVRAAARKAINHSGRINHAYRHAEDLLPGLTHLAVSELIRLKAIRAFNNFRSRLGL